MKKLTSLLLMITLVVSVSAQLEPVYAYKVFFGDKSTPSTTWNAGSDCSILIELGKSSVIIHSKTEQIYRTTRSLFETENSQTWLAIDDEDIRCHITVGYSDGFDSTYIMIEYSDISIIYLTVSE